MVGVVVAAVADGDEDGDSADEYDGCNCLPR